MSCASSMRHSCATSCASCVATSRRSAPRKRPRARLPLAGPQAATSPSMPAVELDRQAIERRDIPMASTAGSQVQSILEAAETAAAEIERHALDAARQVREAADRDAESTRVEAVEKARAHVAAVAQVTATLLERVGSMDGEVSGLIESLRSGAGRLAADLSAVEAGMGELYDAASGRNLPEREHSRVFESELDDALGTAPAPAPTAVQPARPAHAPAEAAQPAPADANPGDLDGARLIALNMALNGESRADTERYLAENYQ